MRFYFETRKEMMRFVKKYESEGMFKKVADCFHAIILKGVYTDDEIVCELI